MPEIIFILMLPFFWPIYLFIAWIIWWYNQRPCSFCNTRQWKMFEPAVVNDWEYIRGENHLCRQAVGDDGYYCYNCNKIEWIRPFEEFSSILPEWCEAFPDDENHKYLGGAT